MISSIGNTNTTTAVSTPPPKRPSSEEMFAKLDTDASGALDETELQAMIDRMSGKMDAEAPSASEMLSRLDTDGDGALSSSEMEAGRPQGPPPGAGGPPPAQEETSLLSELLELYSSSDEDKATMLQYEGVLA